MDKITKPYMHYSNRGAFAETSSVRQAKQIKYGEGEFKDFTKEERKQLKRGQFAFGSLYPYIFDGLANAATHLPELFQDHDKRYYVLEMSIDDLCHLSLMEYKKYSKEYFLNELLRRGGTSDIAEAKHLRWIPISKGKYISIQPLVIGFEKETQKKLQPSKLKRLMNLTTFNKHTRINKTVRIYVLKLLIESIFKGYAGGWFSCPNALQAKINYMIHILKGELGNYYPDDLKEPLFLRKYFLYLNAMNRSKNNADHITANAIDLWEHVSPSEITENGKYIHIRDGDKTTTRLENANWFFNRMNDAGLMKGAKSFPAINETTFPKGVFYNEITKEYDICFKRDRLIDIQLD
jgi:hypothetical protein